MLTPRAGLGKLVGGIDGSLRLDSAPCASQRSFAADGLYSYRLNQSLTLGGSFHQSLSNRTCAPNINNPPLNSAKILPS